MEYHAHEHARDAQVSLYSVSGSFYSMIIGNNTSASDFISAVVYIWPDLINTLSEIFITCGT